MKKILSTMMIAVMAFSQTHYPLLDNKLKKELLDEISGELAKDHVIQITRHSRIQGSREFRTSANYVLDQLHKFGYSKKEAYIESFLSDGKKHYQTWQSPSGWHMEKAELRMVEPYDELVASYPNVAMSLITYSNPGKAKAELVYVGSGTSDADYEGKNVKNKIVLATGYGGSVHRLAVLKYGAKAVVCYLNDYRAEEYPDMLQYTGMWPKTNELEKVTFGFNISKRKGEKLRKLLEAGKKVIMDASAEGPGLESFFMDVPVLVIKGSEKPDEELVFSAHLDHPKESANDNASGSSALLDMARTLKILKAQGKINPKRTIRFIWIPEFYGTMAYIDAHPEMVGPDYGGKFLANINMDMVGENQELLHSIFAITRTPNSIPSVLNDVVKNMLEMVAGTNIRTVRGSLSEMNYRFTGYSGGSDHNMFIDRRIPGMMFWHNPDYTHHTSEDTPDKVDPVELERAEMIALSSFLYLSDLNTNQAKQLLNLSYQSSLIRLNDAFQKTLTHELSPEEKINTIKMTTQVETKSLSSINHFIDDAMIKDRSKKYAKAILAQSELYLSTINSGIKRSNKNSDMRIPKRLTRGPINGGFVNDKMSQKQKDWYSKQEARLSGTMKFEIHNFMDGKTTIGEIRNHISAQFYPVPLMLIQHYIEDLVDINLVKLD